jgi:hypothetical protein
MHKCTKVETFFRHHFHTCETFLLNIPQHGLYNISYSDNRDNILLSVIIENGIDVRKYFTYLFISNKKTKSSLLFNRIIVLFIMNKMYSNQIP